MNHEDQEAGKKLPREDTDSTASAPDVGKERARGARDLTLLWDGYQDALKLVGPYSGYYSASSSVLALCAPNYTLGCL